MGEFYTKLSGTTFDGRDEVIENLYFARKLEPGQPLILKREPYNPYDRNAIAVLHPETMQQLGFVRKEVASTLAPNIERGFQYRAYVSAVTGGTEYNYGINIKIVG